MTAIVLMLAGGVTSAGVALVIGWRGLQRHAADSRALAAASAVKAHQMLLAVEQLDAAERQWVEINRYPAGPHPDVTRARPGVAELDRKPTPAARRRYSCEEGWL